MSTNTDVQPTPAQGPEVELERKRHPWLWIAVAALVVGGIAWAVTSMMGQSVLYYKTPTEVVSSAHTPVRLAGTLVKGSIVNDDAKGVTTFSVTDDKTTVEVVYTGATTVALTTAAQPGTKLVAEGSLGDDGMFHSDKLLAKCPSKFQAGGGSGAQS